MTEEVGQHGEFDEVLGQYPDLARARELFIDLFQDRTPLVNLGYTVRQIEFALPVLRLLEDEGEVKTYIRNKPFLRFSNPDDPMAESLEVYHLPKKEGFYLSAARDESLRSLDDLTKDQRMWQMIFTEQPVVIFQDFPVEVAHIGLFEEGADINNLDYLVRQCCAIEGFTRASLGMRAENPVTKAARAVGAAATYRVAWVDDQTRLEFVAKIDIPEDKKPVYVTYRKLQPVSDLKGSMTPIGKKANTSEHKVTQILSARSRQAISGELVWGNSRA